MSRISIRRPFYALCAVVALVTTGYFLGVLNRPDPHLRHALHDIDLPDRVANSHTIYDRFLQGRQALIKKFGPTPNDVEVFPPNKDPWPPYTVWDFFLPAFNCPHEVRRIGALGDGGKWVCGLSRLETKPDCIIYSFGINLESSFEAELLANTRHCEIWGYDFSVKSFGPEIPRTRRGRTHFYQFGLSGKDRISDEGYPFYTIESLMKKNGHTHIDILKVDIESWEFETLSALLEHYVDSGKPLPFGQLQLEIHLWNKSFAQFLTWWESLEAAGLRPFATEPNLVYQNYAKNADLAEYSFLNVKGDNVFTKDPAPPRDGHDEHHRRVRFAAKLD